MPITTSDALLWYNVGDWADYGLAVPNFGDDGKTQNVQIQDLTAVIGRNMQAVMLHADARLRTPPSINTVARLHALCVRARTVLAGRAKPSNVPNMEVKHALPAPEDFLVFPVPYFKVRNPWLKRWCQLALLSLTEAYQHTENAKSLEISDTFRADIGQFFDRIYQNMAVELFSVGRDEAAAPGFTLGQEHFAAYAPEKLVTSTEMIDTVPNLSDWLTEDSARILTDGIPTSNLPELPNWPGSGTSKSAKSTGGSTTSSDSFLTPGLPGVTA